MSPALLALQNVSFLGCGPYSFSLSKGECLGISGNSGVGKTQLLRAISDLIPSTGKIMLGRSPKDSYEATTWRSTVTMLPTDSVWWYDDVGSHFMSLSGKLSLEQMCIHLELSPEVKDWKVDRLSTGEKQRLALIRSLQIQPEILLLDEPTSALDAVNTQLVEHLLMDLCRAGTISLIWVSHDTAQLERLCDSILLMDRTSIKSKSFHR